MSSTLKNCEMWLNQLHRHCAQDMHNTSGHFDESKSQLIQNASSGLCTAFGSDEQNITREKVLLHLLERREGVATLIHTLQLCSDLPAQASIVRLIRLILTEIKVFSATSRHTFVTNLLSTEAPTILTKFIASHLKEDAFLFDLLNILVIISGKDNHYGMKVRLSGSAKALHTLLRHSLLHPKYLHLTLQLLCTVCHSGLTSLSLAKDTIMPTIDRLLSSLGYRSTTRLTMTLQMLARMSKNKQVCFKLSSLLPHFIHLLNNWQKFGKKKQVKILELLMTIFTHLAASVNGRRALSKNGVPVTLYNFCSNCPVDEEAFMEVVTTACAVIHKCCAKKPLPVSIAASPFRVKMPVREKPKIDPSWVSNSSSDCSDSEGESKKIPSSETAVSVTSNPMIDQHKTRSAPNINVTSKADNEDEEWTADLQAYLNFYPEFTCGIQQFDHKVTRKCKWDWFHVEGQCTCEKSALCCVANCENPEDMTSLMEQEMKLLKTNSLGSVPSRQQKELHSDSKLLTICGSALILQDHPNPVPLVTGPVINIDLTFAGAVPAKQPSILEAMSSLILHDNSVYGRIAAKIHRVVPFVKVGYPDMVGAQSFAQQEMQVVGSSSVAKQKQLDALNVICMNPEKCYPQKTVFDLDALLTHQGKLESTLTNDDAFHVGKPHARCKHLRFESRFESGNLRKAIQIGNFEYDLILTPDINTSRHIQWFYFHVSNMESGLPYVFNIVNSEKPNSQFNYGMQPVVFSVREHILRGSGWKRMGEAVCYYRNGFRNGNFTRSKKSYFSATFTLTFKHDYDVCYVAYHFPYTYTRLLTEIHDWQHKSSKVGVIFKVCSLTQTRMGNDVPLITITALQDIKQPIKERQLVFLTARVHPGESNASWVARGCINYLLTAEAKELLKHYVFKIVPMLNVEGVINGWHRIGLASDDLNRQWKNPCPNLHPSIYHAKALIHCASRILFRTPWLYCDFHGHSRRKNVFLYGCARQFSWFPGDRAKPQPLADFTILPHLMAQICPSFSLDLCNFRVDRSKESTARVAVWRDVSLGRSYTLESSYCGCDQGPYKELQATTYHLEEVGSCLCKVILTHTLDVPTNIEDWGLTTSDDKSTSSDKTFVDDESICSSSASDSDSDS